MTTATWTGSGLDVFGEPARWVLGRMADLGIGVETDPRVQGDISVDEPGRTLLLSPNLLHDWTRTHWRLCRGSLYLTGGPSWAPELDPRPELFRETYERLQHDHDRLRQRYQRARLIEIDHKDSNVVVPIFRRPW